MSENTKKPKEQALMETYIAIGEENDSVEMDLIFMREKGRAQQFLEITIKSKSEDGKNVISAMKIIDTEEEFNLLKNHINQLIWEQI